MQKAEVAGMLKAGFAFGAEREMNLPFSKAYLLVPPPNGSVEAAQQFFWEASAGFFLDQMEAVVADPGTWSWARCCFSRWEGELEHGWGNAGLWPQKKVMALRF